jgi:hypothetical protein
MATTQDTRTRSAQRKIFEDTFLQPRFVPLQIAQAIRRREKRTDVRSQWNVQPVRSEGTAQSCLLLAKACDCD